MSMELFRNVLLWNAIMNYGILVVWLLVFVNAHEWLRHVHGKWFRVSAEHFDALHYGGMTLYKIGIFLLNLVPFMVLTILGAQ